MTVPTTRIILEAGETGIPVAIRTRDTEKSKHSGRDLRVLTGRSRAAGQQYHTQFMQILRDHPDGLPEKAGLEPSSHRWLVDVNSYSEIEGEYSYELTLREFEDLKVNSLTLGDLDLVPTKYKEDVHDGEVHVHCVVELSLENRAKLRELMKKEGYFPVRRIGISDQPVEMRFGMCGWSEHGDMTKYRLILVDRKYDQRDTSKGPHISTIESANRRSTLVYRAELLEELIILLKAKGIMSDSEIEAARNRAQTAMWDRAHGLLRATDADELAW